jgi:hypothetical protein
LTYYDIGKAKRNKKKKGGGAANSGTNGTATKDANLTVPKSNDADDDGTSDGGVSDTVS